MSSLARRRFLALTAGLLPGHAHAEGCKVCGDSSKAELKRMGSVDDYGAFRYPEQRPNRSVYHKGVGPGVLILPELPGLTPCDLEFGRRLAGAGFHVFLPLLFGKPGADYGVFLGTLKACPGSNFDCGSKDGPQGILNWLRPLCREIYQKTKEYGQGIGVVGMCLTGALPLALLSEKEVLAPVLSQPSLPFGSSLDKRRALGIAKGDLDHAIQNRSDVPILGFRFETDWISARDRFDTLEKLFPNRFRAMCLRSQRAHTGSKHGNHAVLSASYCDEPGSSTRIAFDETVKFLKSRIAIS